MPTMRLLSPFLVFLGLCACLGAGTADDETGVVLIEACRTGDLATVQSELARGVDLNIQDREKMTPLIHALDARQIRVARYLLERGAQVRHGEDEVSPLNYAVRCGDASMADLLLQHGASFERDSRYDEPIHQALCWADAAMLKTLDAHGADLPRWAYLRKNALSYAATHNNLEALTYLLSRGMDPNQPDPEGNYPLARAALQSHFDMVERLLAAGADPNAIGTGALNIQDFRPEPHTALIAAVRDNSLKMVNLLIAVGAKPALLGNTAIRYADLAGNWAIYKRLLEAGAPDPSPYSFLKIEVLDPMWSTMWSKSSKAPIDWANLSVVNNAALAPSRVDGVTYDGPPITIAVIPTGKNFDEAEALTTAGLSAAENIRLVERAQLQKVIEEWALARSGAMDVNQSIRIGALAGADCLVILGKLGDLVQAQIVSTATGLVLKVVPAQSKNLTSWSDEIRDQVLLSAPVLGRGAEEFTLVSIPNLTSTRSEPGSFDQTRSLAQALAIYLGAIDGVYILDRRHMAQLAGEKTLTEDMRSFFGSGWVIDGNYDTNEENLTIKLRLRQTHSGRDLRLEATGSLADPQEVLSTLSEKVAAAMGSQNAPPRNVDQEANGYLRESERAYKLSQWEIAQQAADAAWAMGNRSDAAMSLRLRSRMDRLRVAATLLKHKLRRLDGQSIVMGYRAPLLLEIFDPRELTATQYLELAGDILSFYQPIIAKPGHHTAFEKDMLTFYPEAAKGILMPLEVLHAISEEKAHQMAIDQLRSDAMRTTLAVLSIARENGYPLIYQNTFAAYLRSLPYLIRDEDALYDEIHARLLEASAMTEPLSRQQAYKSLAGIAMPHMNSYGGQAGSSWQRMALRMIESENLYERVMGYDLTRRDTSDYQARFAYSYAMMPLIERMVREEKTLHGLYEYTDPEIHDNLKIEGTFRIYPEYTNDIWCPNPYDVSYGNLRRRHGDFHRILDFNSQPKSLRHLTPHYREYLYQRYMNRLRCIAESGSVAIDKGSLSSSLNYYSIRELEDMATLAIEAGKAVDRRVANQPQWKRTAHAFRVQVVERIQKALADSREKLAPPEAVATLKLPPFQTPLFDPNNPQDAKARRSAVFSPHGTVPSKSGLWGADNSIGFFHYDIARQTTESVFLPPTNSTYKEYTEYFDDERIAVWFQWRDHKPFMEIGVYEFTRKNWRYFKPDRVPPDYKKLGGSILGVTDIIVLEENLYYSYLMHPSPKRLSINAIYQDAETTKGIAMINLATGKETLLVSGRRIPAESPIDNIRAGTYSIIKVSETSLLSAGHIYDESTEQWSAAPRKVVKQDTDVSNVPFYYKQHYVKADYDGDRTTLTLTATPRGKNVASISITIKLELTGWDQIAIPPEFEKLNAIYEKLRKKPIFSAHANQSGVIISNRIGFYFIDRQTVIDLLQFDKAAADPGS